MENALLFTGLLLGAALTGGYFGSCCARSRQSEDVAQKLQALQDRVEFLETKAQNHEERLCLCERYDGESAQRIAESERRLAECELLIGDPPTEGLLGRVGELEEARRREGLLNRVNILHDTVTAHDSQLDALKGKLELFEGGISLEVAGLRMAVEKLEGKANG